MEQKEIWVFGNCLLSGVGTGMIFDVFRIIRKSFKSGYDITNLCDALFWSVYTLVFAWWIFNINDGELRWFVFAGMSLGGAFYFALLSRIFVPSGVFLVKTLKKAAGMVLKVLLFPLKLILKITGKVWIFAVMPIRKIKKKIVVGLKIFHHRRMIRYHQTKKYKKLKKNALQEDFGGI